MDSPYRWRFKRRAIMGILKMGEYNEDKKQFSKRDSTTMADFPELNKKALSFANEILCKYHYNYINDDRKTKGISDSNSFSEVYAFGLNKFK